MKIGREFTIYHLQPYMLCYTCQYVSQSIKSKEFENKHNTSQSMDMDDKYKILVLKYQLCHISHEIEQ